MIPLIAPLRLSTWPTPLEPAPRLAQALGLGADDLWLKRDDVTGLAMGGNKIRKLEWTVAAAVAAGANTLVTCGAAQSNHARLTAAAGARLGLDVVLVLAGSPPASATGNFLLDGLLGARVVWAGEADNTRLEAVAETVAGRLRAEGAVPGLIPFGGSSPLGALGYVTCAAEIRHQLADVATVVVAVGSGGTMAGLVQGLGVDSVLGVHCGAVADPFEIVDRILVGMGRNVPDGALRIRTDQVGSGYGELTEAAAAAMTLAARTEGVVLDPVYTGRAMAGLIAAVDDGSVRPGRRTVFVHTGGGPGIFGHPAALSSPMLPTASPFPLDEA